MRKRSLMVIAGIAASVALAPAPSQAGHGARCGHHCGQDCSHVSLMRLESLASSEHVTDGQRTKLRALADKFRPHLRIYGDQLRQARHDLAAQMESDTPDIAKIRAAAEAQGKAMGELMAIRAQIRMSMTSIVPDGKDEPFWKYHNRRPTNSAAAHCRLPGVHGQQGAVGSDVPAGKNSGQNEQKKPNEDPESAQL